MWGTAATSIAAVTDQIPFVYHVTRLDQHVLQVRIPGLKTKVMDDHNTVATKLRVVCTSYKTICRRKHFFARLGPYVDSLVE